MGRRHARQWNRDTPNMKAICGSSMVSTVATTTNAPPLSACRWTAGASCFTAPVPFGNMACGFRLLPLLPGSGSVVCRIDSLLRCSAISFNTSKGCVKTWMVGEERGQQMDENLGCVNTHDFLSSWYPVI